VALSLLGLGKKKQLERKNQAANAPNRSEGGVWGAPLVKK